MWELGRGRRLRGADAVDAAVAVGVETQFMLDNVDAPAMYPHVNTLLGPLRKASAASGDSTHVAAWAGSGFRHAREGSVDAIMQNLYPDLVENHKKRALECRFMYVFTLDPTSED